MTTLPTPPEHRAGPPSPGVVRVARLAATPRELSSPVRSSTASPVQGALALSLDSRSGMPATPGLRVLTGGRRDVEEWSARFMQAVVEVLNGDRNVQQLVRCTSAAVHEDMVRRTTVLNRAAPPEQRRRRLRTQVRSIHVSCPTTSAAEVAAVVRHGARSRAVAARLEITSTGWRCTALVFG